MNYIYIYILSSDIWFPQFIFSASISQNLSFIYKITLIYYFFNFYELLF